MNKAKNLHDYLVFSQEIDADIASMHDDLVQGASSYLIGAIDRQAAPGVRPTPTMTSSMTRTIS